jgi:hypothetical protein
VIKVAAILGSFTLFSLTLNTSIPLPNAVDRNKDVSDKEWTVTPPFLDLVRNNPAGSSGLCLITLKVLTNGNNGASES